MLLVLLWASPLAAEGSGSDVSRIPTHIITASSLLNHVAASLKQVGNFSSEADIIAEMWFSSEESALYTHIAIITVYPFVATTPTCPSCKLPTSITLESQHGCDDTAAAVCIKTYFVTVSGRFCQDDVAGEYKFNYTATCQQSIASSDCPAVSTQYVSIDVPAELVECSPLSAVVQPVYLSPYTTLAGTTTNSTAFFIDQNITLSIGVASGLGAARAARLSAIRVCERTSWSVADLTACDSVTETVSGLTFNETSGLYTSTLPFVQCNAETFTPVVDLGAPGVLALCFSLLGWSQFRNRTSYATNFRIEIDVVKIDFGNQTFLKEIDQDSLIRSHMALQLIHRDYSASHSSDFGEATRNSVGPVLLAIAIPIVVLALIQRVARRRRDYLAVTEGTAL